MLLLRVCRSSTSRSLVPPEPCTHLIERNARTPSCSTAKTSPTQPREAAEAFLWFGASSRCRLPPNCWLLQAATLSSPPAHYRRRSRPPDVDSPVTASAAALEMNFRYSFAVENGMEGYFYSCGGCGVAGGGDRPCSFRPAKTSKATDEGRETGVCVDMTVERCLHALVRTCAAAVCS